MPPWQQTFSMCQTLHKHDFWWKIMYGKKCINFVKNFKARHSKNVLSIHKLDHETWLCWTHLDDFFVDKNVTILDHIWLYYTILDHVGDFGPLWTRFETFRIILDHFELFWYILVHFGQVWTILDKFSQIWTILDHFSPFLSISGQFGICFSKRVYKSKSKALDPQEQVVGLSSRQFVLVALICKWFCKS